MSLPCGLSLSRAAESHATTAHKDERHEHLGEVVIQHCKHREERHGSSGVGEGNRSTNEEGK
jgi:hypothetical protein